MTPLEDGRRHHKRARYQHQASGTSPAATRKPQGLEETAKSTRKRLEDQRCHDRSRLITGTERGTRQARKGNQDGWIPEPTRADMAGTRRQRLARRYGAKTKEDWSMVPKEGQENQWNTSHRSRYDAQNQSPSSTTFGSSHSSKPGRMSKGNRFPSQAKGGGMDETTSQHLHVQNTPKGRTGLALCSSDSSEDESEEKRTRKRKRKKQS